MGTVAGVNTRRYHALLVASLAPGSGRRVLFARVEEEAVVDGRSFALGACQYPGVVTPRGFELLEEFRPEPCATWVYSVGGIRLEKQVYLVEGKQAVVIRYRADRALTLRVRPFLADRDYHSLQHAGNWTSRTLQFHCEAQLHRRRPLVLQRRVPGRTRPRLRFPRGSVLARRVRAGSEAGRVDAAVRVHRWHD